MDSKKSFPVRNPDIVEREEQKESLLFNPADGYMLCINKTGGLVWDLCDGSHSVKDIVKEITERYEVSLEKAEEDCFTYLKDLEKAKFIGYKI